MNAEEATYWHIETAIRALENARQAMNERHDLPPVTQHMHMMDRIRLVKEHMEELEFDYDRFWQEHLDPHRG